MSLNFNKVVLAGRLTAAPELKQTPNGIFATSFTIAVDRPYSKGAEKKTDFISCTTWRGTAEFVSKYFSKGSPICVCGSIQTRSWQDNDGFRHYVTEVIADEVKFVENKSTSEQGEALPAYAAETSPQFEELSPDDDLPF